MSTVRVGVDDFNEVPTRAVGEPPSIVTAEEFIAVDEPGAEALVGDSGDVLVGEDSNVMYYGDGGAGKTTVTADLSFHLAAGDDWLTMTVARPVRVLIVENEGPRALFRKKIARKVAGWAGSPVEDRLLFWEAPWAEFTFADEQHRLALAAIIREREVDVVVIGPLTASGMDEAGTLAQTQDFIRLLNDVRRLAGRRVTFVLVHHENKGGKVSGAWEARGDTLFHVQGQGNGRTRLFVQKARWASAQHGTSLQLLWADGESFTLEEKPELDDDAIAELIREQIRANAGTAWGKVEDAIKGVANDRIRMIRDGLFAKGEIVNLAKVDGVEVLLSEVQERRTPRLYLADDPTIAHLRRDRGAAAAQSAPPLDAGDLAATAPCAVPIRHTAAGAAQMHPQNDLFDDAGGET